MTLAHALPASSRGNSRWLLLGSLALNLFFVGIALAMAIRAPAPPPRWNPNVFVRAERLATALPQADADLLRSAMQANHDAIDGAQNKYHSARDRIHDTLRQDPFRIEELRAAMADTRAARQAYDQVIQGVFADIAPAMSSAGRHTVADWRSTKTTGNTQ